jgi:hypothetical protein
MLFKILKLFGLDVPAEIDAVKARIDLRVEQATDKVKEAARNAAIMAALSACAAVTGIMALGIAAFAAYRWIAENYGVYVGLGVVGGVLAALTLIFVVIAMGTGRSLAPRSRPRVVTPAVAVAEAALERDMLNAASAADAVRMPPPVAPFQPTPSAVDFVAPMSLLISKFVRYPTLGNPLLDQFIDQLKFSARGTADDAIGSAANVVRSGDRSSLVLVLGSAALAGWLLTRHHSDVAP